MTLMFADIKKQAFATMQTRRKIRLRITATGELLHMSGSGTTSDVHYSWLGTHAQADTLESRARAKDEPWPFSRITHGTLSETTIDSDPVPL